MRLATYAMAVVLALCAIGRAAPPKATIKPDRGEIEKLDKELTQLQIKQAYVAAIKVARKLYELQVKTTGKDSIEAERRKQTLAGMVNAAGDYAESVKLYKELLADAERKHGPDSREVLYALMPLSGPYWAQNRLDDLEPIYQRLLQITKKINGEKSQEYAQQLLQYGTLLNARNEYSSAQRVYEQCLKIMEAVFPNKNDVNLLGPVQTLAMAYWQTNQKPKAIALYDRAIKIAEAMPNATVMQVAATIWGVASQYHYGGRDDLAAPLIKRVTTMYTKEIERLEKASPSQDDYQIPMMYGMLGFTYRQANDLANAEKTFEKAIAYDEKKTAGYSGWTGSLAEIKRAQGKPKEALVLLEKAQAQIAKLAPQAATAFNYQIADVVRELGDYKRAETLLVAHRAAMEKQYGKKHPIYGMTELSMSYVYMGAGKIAEAEKLLTDSLEIAERELQNVLKTGTESDHAVYFSRNTYQLDTAINFHLKYAPKSGSAAKLALTTLLRRKGRVLDAAAASLATIRAKLSADDKKLLDELASARAKLAKLTVAGPTATGDAGEFAKEVAALEEQIQKLELAVGKKSAQYRIVSQQIELAAIQKMIPKDARLIEIVNFQPGDPKAPYSVNPVLPPRHYAAYVVGASGDPKVVDLGEAKPIDEAVEKFRKAVADPDNAAAADLGKALFDLTMAKVVPLLGGSTNLLIAPDGALNVVPFSALVDGKKQFLIKTYTFTYLTSGRDLLRLSAKTKAQGGGVIFADPSFDATGAAKPGGTTRGVRSADVSSLSWPPLPGTGAEAEAVVKTMKGLTLFRGDKATEGAVKGVKGPKVLHLATHGFFLPDEPPPAAAQQPDNRTAPGAPAAPTPAPPMAAPGVPLPQAKADSYENPLLRSGLAFAGANKLSSGDEDGILTALEASGLDLTGTKLVVLSACETGVGKVTNGEGVYGLRRALVIAGAESLVMTLWQVDDFATKELMSGYYTRLGAGKPRSSALRDVQLEIMSRDKYKHPFYWASFLPAGLNSPIKE